MVGAIIGIVLVILFLLMNAFFVVAEFALVRVRHSQLEIAVEEGKKGAKSAKRIAENINAYLSACQLGITLASLALGWVGEPAVAAILEMPLLALGLPEEAVYPVCVIIGFILVTSFHVIVGELIPKSFAIFSTEKYALSTATPLYWFYRITYPIMVVFNGITTWVVKLFGHDPADEREVYTDDEIRLLIDESTEIGLIKPEQNEFVDNIFDLGNKDAEDIMTPRIDVICLDLDDPLEDNLKTIQQYKYSRYPVIRGSKDHIVGFVNMKDHYGKPDDLPLKDWNIRDIPAVPESIPIARLLETLQEKRVKMGLVVDEHGGMSGIVTISDIIEQIVGRIDDEYVHDIDEEVVQLPDGTYLIDGALAIDDLEDVIGFVPEEAKSVETAAGLLLNLFDRIPKVGDVAVLDHKRTHLTFTVVDMDKRRIDKISLLVKKDPEEEED